MDSLSLIIYRLNWTPVPGYYLIVTIVYVDYSYSSVFCAYTCNWTELQGMNQTCTSVTVKLYFHHNLISSFLLNKDIFKLGIKILCFKLLQWNSSQRSPLNSGHALYDGHKPWSSLNLHRLVQKLNPWRAATLIIRITTTCSFSHWLIPLKKPYSRPRGHTSRKNRKWVNDHGNALKCNCMSCSCTLLSS